MDMPLMPREGAAHLAALLPMGKLGSQPVSRHVLLSYTEDYAIDIWAASSGPTGSAMDLPAAGAG